MVVRIDRVINIQGWEKKPGKAKERACKHRADKKCSYDAKVPPSPEIKIRQPVFTEKWEGPPLLLHAR
jgi:hypothetical protein